jgi:hypothetical protein
MLQGKPDPDTFDLKLLGVSSRHRRVSFLLNKLLQGPGCRLCSASLSNTGRLVEETGQGLDDLEPINLLSLKVLLLGLMPKQERNRLVAFNK